MRAVKCDGCTWSKSRNDGGYGAVFGSRTACQNGFSFAVVSFFCTDCRVGLPACSRVLSESDPFTCDLSCQIDLHTRINRRHLVVSSDDTGVIAPFSLSELNGKVVIEPCVEVGASHRECTNKLSWQQGFCLVGDVAVFVECFHGVDEHFGVYAEVIFVFEFLGGCVGDAADTKLDGGTIFDEGSDVFAYGSVCFVDLFVWEARDGVFGVDEVVDFVDVDVGITVGPGHIWVDFEDDDVGFLEGVFFVYEAQSEADVAMCIWRGARADEDMRLADKKPIQYSAVEHIGDKSDGPELLFHGGTGWCTVEPARQLKVPSH